MLHQKDLKAVLLYVALHVVDVPVLLHHLAGKRGIAVAQSRHRPVDRLLRRAAHCNQLSENALKLLFVFVPDTHYTINPPEFQAVSRICR